MAASALSAIATTRPRVPLPISRRTLQHSALCPDATPSGSAALRVTFQNKIPANFQPHQSTRSCQDHSSRTRLPDGHPAWVEKQLSFTRSLGLLKKTQPSGTLRL